MSKRIVIIAGEASGDMHGAHLINHLKEISPEIEISGLGGKLMQTAGAEIYYNLVNLAVIGFFEVLQNLSKFKGAFKLLLTKIDQKKPDAVILIDYPGFNLKIAREIKKRGIPIIYYISPQVWAWGQGRLKTIKKLVDIIIVVFKFEEELYQKEGINVYFAGHPLMDMVKSGGFKEAICAEHHLDENSLSIALMPGSRENEIKRILPVMLDTALMLHEDNNQSQFIVVKSPSVAESVYTQILSRHRAPARLIENSTYDILEIADFALICSGTATLEAAIMQTPMVIIYKVSFATWLCVRNLIKIPYIGLVNIVAGEKIVPEFVQFNARPDIIYKACKQIIYDKDKKEEMIEGLKKVKNSLGEPGASRRAAEAVISFLNQS